MNPIKVLIAGDFFPSGRISQMIEQTDFSFFKGVNDLFHHSDYSVVNLECAIADSSVMPIIKQGPSLKCSSKILSALKSIKIDCLTLANNHFYDYGDTGVANTIRLLKECQIDYVGGGENIEEASKTLYKTIKGVRFAFINFCEHEFSIATNNKGGSNPLNLCKLYSDIQNAKSIADFVIIISHGGNELCQLPSPRMKEMFHFLVDVGADVVVNHHQHCYSGYEYYQGKPIVYGLGNFCFDNNTDEKMWHEGYVANFVFEGKNICFSPIPYTQCAQQPVITLLNFDQLVHFNYDVNKLNCIIADDTLLNEQYNTWMLSRSSSILATLEPYSKRWSKALSNRHLLPSILSQNYLLKLLNNVECEANRDTFIFAMKDYIYNETL